MSLGSLGCVWAGSGVSGLSLGSLNSLLTQPPPHFPLSRLQTGMRGAFGKPQGTVARVHIGQVIMSIRTKAQNKEHVVEALRRAKFKFPGRQKVPETPQNIPKTAPGHPKKIPLPKLPQLVTGDPSRPVFVLRLWGSQNPENSTQIPPKFLPNH
uniref:Ribosomal protein L10e/L16 domain-containing protein n=1 Tax=Zosterops lateralis melanops TaxID=1220523 RepID=A0A8D2NU45_ZOSLA